MRSTKASSESMRRVVVVPKAAVHMERLRTEMSSKAPSGFLSLDLAAGSGSCFSLVDMVLTHEALSKIARSLVVPLMEIEKFVDLDV